MSYFCVLSTIKHILPAAPSQSSLTTIPLYDSSGHLLEIKSRASVVVSTVITDSWSI